MNFGEEFPGEHAKYRWQTCLPVIGPSRWQAGYADFMLRCALHLQSYMK